jgi:hypothetical protein
MTFVPTPNIKLRDKKRHGPYSLSIKRGAIGTLSGRTTAGKFIRRIEGELLAEIAQKEKGEEPTFAQKLLVRRVARMMWQLDQFDRRFDEGSITDFDTKMIGGMTNAVRLSLVALGLKRENQKPKPSRENVEKYLANYGRGKTFIGRTT